MHPSKYRSMAARISVCVRSLWADVIVESSLNVSRRIDAVSGLDLGRSTCGVVDRQSVGLSPHPIRPIRLRRTESVSHNRGTALRRWRRIEAIA